MIGFLGLKWTFRKRLCYKSQIQFSNCHVELPEKTGQVVETLCQSHLI